MGTISVNGQKVAEGRISDSAAFLLTADKTIEVGIDEATPLKEDYAGGDNEFTEKMQKMTVELK